MRGGTAPEGARILVFGSINMDLIVRLPHLPQPGETVGNGRFASAPGGKGANQALAAARAGAAVRLLGAVGRDAFGGESLTLLQEAGVDLSGVATVAEPTGTALILVEEGGENEIAVAPGANRLAKGTADLGDAQVLLCQLEVPHGENRLMLERAGAAGIASLLNLAPFDPAAGAYCRLADVLVMNRREAEDLARSLGLAGETPQALCRRLAEACDSAVVVTLGHEGLVARLAGEEVALPAPTVSARDCVGAGDAFCGYLAEALGRCGQLDRAALVYASRAAALTCTRHGAQPAIPSRREVEAVASS